MLEVGAIAPAFTLSNQYGNPVSLSEYRGRKVVLYFYPRDNTPGCAREAVAFARAYENFKSKDVAIIGISKDSVASHLKFAGILSGGRGAAQEQGFVVGTVNCFF